MRIIIRKVRLIVLLATVLVYTCLGADSLLGLWQSAIGHDNSIECYTMIEFLKDGKCNKTTVLKNPDGKVVKVPLNGTYKIVDTNHIEIALVYNTLTPNEKMKFHLSYALTNDVLLLQTFDETGGFNKFQKVKSQ